MLRKSFKKDNTNGSEKNQNSWNSYQLKITGVKKDPTRVQEG